MCGLRFLKKKHQFFLVWDLVTTDKQTERNLFLHYINTSKLRTTWSLALLTHNFLSNLQFFKVGEIMVSKYGYSMLPGEFPDIRSYPWYWFYRWSNISVLWSSCKNTFVGAGNLQMITNKFWCENLWGPYLLYIVGPSFVYSFTFLRSWSI